MYGRRYLRRDWWLIVGLGVVIGGASHVCGQETVTLSGKVLNSAQEPVGDTTIYVYGPNSRLLATAETESNGDYLVRLPPSETPIFRVKYDNQDYQIETVVGLSARAGDHHVINKVLFDKRGPRSFELIVDQILTYEGLRMSSEFDRKSALNQARTQDDLDSAQEVCERRLRKLYGERILNIPHPLRQRWRGHPLWNEEQYDEQREAVARLTPLQRDVIDRMMGDLLYRYGYTERAIYDRPTERFAPAPAPPQVEGP